MTRAQRTIRAALRTVRCSPEDFALLYRNLTGNVSGRTVREVEDKLVKRIPPEMLRDAHHWLILHGRYVCKARAPECWRCVAAEFCRFPDKTLPPLVKPPKH